MRWQGPKLLRPACLAAPKLLRPACVAAGDIFRVLLNQHIKSKHSVSRVRSARSLSSPASLAHASKQPHLSAFWLGVQRVSMSKSTLLIFAPHPSVCNLMGRAQEQQSLVSASDHFCSWLTTHDSTVCSLLPKGSHCQVGERLHHFGS